MVFSSRHWKYRVSTCWKPSQLGGLSGISQPSTPKMFLMKNCWIWSSSLHSFGVQVLDLRSVVSDGDFTMISGKNGLILNKSELMVVHNDESWVNDGGFRSNGGDPQWLDGWFPWENPMKIRMITFGVPPPMTSETSRCGGLRNPALISCENAGFCDLPQYDGFKPMPKMTGGRTGAKKNCDKNGTNWCQGLTYGMPWQEKIPVWWFIKLGYVKDLNFIGIPVISVIAL